MQNDDGTLNFRQWIRGNTFYAPYVNYYYDCYGCTWIRRSTGILETKIFKRVSGSSTDLTSTDYYGTVTTADELKYSVQAEGTTIKLFLDDVEIQSATDSSHSTGRAGFSTSRYDYHDDFVIESVGSPPAPAGISASKRTINT